MAALLRPGFLSRATTPLRARPGSILTPRQSQQSLIRHQSSITSTSTTSSSPSIPETSPTPPEPDSGAEQFINYFEPLTYHVHRTPGQQLPIYHLAKAGGNKHQTRIRRITGSVEDLKNDLRHALGLGEREIVINSVNGHVVIKGWKKFEVARFLEEKHF